ncbi:MAG: SH3 domain-containing protein [Chloroflexi bacterium]|nr:SH3 domain-containing protein [Chloroflexota bacterium]MCI0577944.1 SH3 domain-containing protein [Chloroflexota bacterium]MCI0646106.1 SH3 domain-containing protein [Chloroflexota bacterium]MCI0731568.1 SH3 domain-containing protein [Chloroflexota bacterium]
MNQRLTESNLRRLMTAPRCAGCLGGAVLLLIGLIVYAFVVARVTTSVFEPGAEETAPAPPTIPVVLLDAPVATNELTAEPDRPVTPEATVMAEACPGAPVPRLSPGGMAQVIARQINLRAAPGLSADQVGLLARDRLVRVLGSPTCADGMYWWQIQNEQLNVAGWAAEGQSGAYFLAPGVSSTP